MRSKSQPRNLSPSEKSLVRSKSQARRPRSRSRSSEKDLDRDRKRKRNEDDYHGNVDHVDERKSLLQGLKLVMSSKELENRLPALKDVLLTLQVGKYSLSFPDLFVFCCLDNI